MDVIFDWNLGNMIYNGLITLRHCGFPFVEFGVISTMPKIGDTAMFTELSAAMRSGLYQ